MKEFLISNSGYSVWTSYTVGVEHEGFRHCSSYDSSQGSKTSIYLAKPELNSVSTP